MNVARSALDRLLADGPLTWLLAGDSITEGWGLADPDLGYAGLFADHLRRRAGPIRALDTVRNSGVAGATVGEALLDLRRVSLDTRRTSRRRPSSSTRAAWLTGGVTD